VYRTGVGEVVALRDVSLTVEDGEFVAVMGPSGSGKTTLLNCLSGLDGIDGGTVWLDGRAIHELRDAERTRQRASSMGFVFQQFNLIPVLTAVENVEVPLLLAGVKPRDARRRAAATLARVGLAGRVEHRPNELSGGEQQRVTIARALAGHPSVVWADEPTGALDSESAADVMALMNELHRDGLTLVLVTHDPAVGAQAQRDDPRHVRDHRAHARLHERDLVHVPRARRRDRGQPVGRLRRRVGVEPQQPCVRRSSRRPPGRDAGRAARVHDCGVHNREPSADAVARHRLRR
jgi:putative ABC transport system ATP-binding protein